MELRSGHVALSATSTPPHGDGVPALAESAIPPDPSQLSATQALQMLDSDVYDDTELLAIADTLISLGARPLIVRRHFRCHTQYGQTQLPLPQGQAAIWIPHWRPTR